MNERATIEINLKKIKENISKIKEYKNEKIMAIVKADCYGLGAKKISKSIQKYVDLFGVATAQEALLLRKNNINKPIVILGYIDESEIETLVDNNIIITVYSNEILEKLQNRIDKKIKVFVAIDTGMKRLGIEYDDDSSLKSIKNINNVECLGAISHYASSGEDYDFCLIQQHRFSGALNKLGLMDIPCGISNSDGIFLKDECNLIRIGISMYGGGSFYYIFALDNAIKITAKIAQIKIVKEGESIGYDRTFFAEKNMKIAIICMGYADGISLNFSNKGSIIVNGKICPIVGKICMDYFMADVTDIDQLKEGDDVIIFGDKLGFSYLSSIGVSHYEFLCGIGRRVKRIYKNK